MSSKDVFNCQFQLWYHRFKSITIESSILKIPDECLNFLKSDGITIPLGYSGTNDLESEKEIVTWMKDIDKIIKELGSFVFPKLNWSSPKDAGWISPDKSLKCQNAEEVILLLKSSDFIVHDLVYPFENCSDKNNDPIAYNLILRGWLDFSGFSELRCFVLNNNLVGVSQRHLDTYVPSLDIKRDSIKNDIYRFFDKHIRGNFDAVNYTFDIYRSDGEEIFLLDFNPFKASTDALLFTWKYFDDLAFLNLSDKRDFEFRIIEKKDYESGIRTTEFAWNAMPVDFLHLSNGLDMNKLEDLLRINELVCRGDEERDLRG